MPYYMFKCPKHGIVEDRLISMASIKADVLPRCTVCNAEMVRVFTSPAVSGLPTTGSAGAQGKVNTVGYFGYDGGGSEKMYDKT